MRDAIPVLFLSLLSQEMRSALEEPEGILPFVGSRRGPEEVVGVPPVACWPVFLMLGLCGLNRESIPKRLVVGCGSACLACAKEDVTGEGWLHVEVKKGGGVNRK